MGDPIACTILLPTYNSEEFIRFTLDSIFKQTFKQFEIICVDDCSTDGTVSIIKDYQSKNPDKVKLICNPRNMGVAFSLKKALLETHSPFCAWIGHDDIWDTNFLESQICELESNIGISATFSKVKYIDQRGKEFKPIRPIFQHSEISGLSQTDLLLRLISGNFLCAPASVFRNGPNVKSYFSCLNDSLQDYEMWLFQSCTGKFFYNEKVTTFYRVHSNNLSLSKNDLNANKFDYFRSWLNLTKNELFGNLFRNLNLENQDSIIVSLNKMATYSPLTNVVVAQLLDLKWELHLESKNSELTESLMMNSCVNLAKFSMFNRSLKFLPKFNPKTIDRLRHSLPAMIISPHHAGPLLKAAIQEYPFLEFKVITEASFAELTSGIFVIEPDILTHFLNIPYVMKGVVEGRAIILTRRKFQSAWKSRFPNLIIATLDDLKGPGILNLVFSRLHHAHRVSQNSYSLFVTKREFKNSTDCILIRDFNKQLNVIFLPDLFCGPVEIHIDGVKIEFTEINLEKNGVRVKIKEVFAGSLEVYLGEKNVCPEWLMVNQEVFVLNQLSFENGKLYFVPGFEFFDLGLGKGLGAEMACIIGKDSETITVSWPPLVKLKKSIDRRPLLKRIIIRTGSLFLNIASLGRRFA